MGYYWQNQMGPGPGWPLVGLFMMAIFLGLVVVVFALLRHYRPWMHARETAMPTTTPSQARSSAIVILQERFARGDIDEDEYRRRLAILHEPPSA